MIIRTQKRKCATTDLNLEIRPSGEEWILENEYFCLGRYSTEEKAIKVLDMIQNAYMNSCKVAISSDGQMQHMVIPVVFQMPQDSEV